MKSLVIGDEFHFIRPMLQILAKNQITAETATDSETGLYYAVNHTFDIILLNAILPKEDGFELIKKLRDQRVTTPLIILGKMSGIDDTVRALDFGADDYIEIPFSSDELFARIRAVYRRRGNFSFENEIPFSDIAFNTETLNLRCGLEEITLTSKEGRILEYLLLNQTSYKTKEEIFMKCWGIESDAAYNSVEVYISFLRKKLSSIHSKSIIKMNRNIGYRIIGENNNASTQT